ncbi:MAG TPA: ABC transporter permease subunit, partial [Propylenella sp.]|nr:ABC transporter permease subunit [Propylenella sp.]
RPDAAGPAIRLADAAVLLTGALLVLPPLSAVLIAGLSAFPSLIRTEVGVATATSFAIAVPAALISLAFSLAVAFAAPSRRARPGTRRALTPGVFASLVLAVPPLALSAGLFVVLRNIVDPFRLALPLIIFVNALMALPFTLRQVEPPLALSAERYGRLADSLGLSGFSRIGIVDWPLLKRPLLAALAVATALSLGDLGVAAFFGAGNLQTLPLLLYERMGAYRLDEAASVAFALSVLVISLFVAAQIGSGDALARSR